MYDVLVNFIGTPPAGCEAVIYLACVAFTLYMIAEFYSLIRLLLMRVTNYGNS